jgi:hypothetical protein
MAVVVEQFGPEQCSVIGTLQNVFDGIRRRRDGTYVVSVKLDGEAVLPDGRRVRIDKYVTLPACQCVGRRKAS